MKTITRRTHGYLAHFEQMEGVFATTKEETLALTIAEFGAQGFPSKADDYSIVECDLIEGDGISEADFEWNDIAFRGGIDLYVTHGAEMLRDEQEA